MLVNNINPILLKIDPLTIRWYGLFLAIGVLLAILILQSLFKERKYKTELLYDLVVWLVIGGLIGARLGHVFFYNAKFFLANPLEILFINHGGLSSHGMTIGLLVTTLLYRWIKKVKIEQYFDILVIPIPLIATFIRLGNFFNSEIIGKPSTLPWAVWFKRVDPEIILRHPSQIYESLIALTIFIILYVIYKKKIFNLQSSIFNLFLLLYFSTRFLVEFVKERHILFDNALSMGQWLSVPFIILGMWWFLARYIRHVTQNNKNV